MSNKTCYFVVGPEGSGTYMMAEALVEAGCTYVANEDGLRYAIKECGEENVVIRRSLPHAGEWIDIHKLLDEMYQVVETIRIIVIFREPYASVESVVARRNITRAKAQHNRVVALRKLGVLAQTTFPVIITYEAVVWSPGFRRWLFEDRLGLSMPDYAFYNANVKYYE